MEPSASTEFCAAGAFSIYSKALVSTHPYLMHIEIDGIPIEIIRKRIKNVTVRIYPPDGLVRVSVPLRYKEQLIRQHLLSKISWINTHRDRIKNTSYPSEEELQTGSSIDFMGNSYLLIIVRHNGPSQVTINDQLLHCYTKHEASPADVQRTLDHWYKREMEALIPELIKKWEPVVGVQVREWGVKKMKTRWGSCNIRAARIWLSLNLIKKPVCCLEYVIVHELVHLLEASHNARFHSLMTQFMPQWKEYQLILEGKAKR